MQDQPIDVDVGTTDEQAEREVLALLVELDAAWAVVGVGAGTAARQRRGDG